MKYLKLVTLFFAIFLLGISNHSLGQNLEELKQRLSKETDREKIETYLDISELGISQDTVLFYLGEAMEVSEKIGFDSIYNIQFAVCVSYYVRGDFERAKTEIRKGFDSYMFTDYPNASLGQINMLLGVFCEYTNDIDSSKYYYDMAMQSLINDTSTKAKETLSAVYTNYGNLHLKYGEFHKAIPIYLNSVKNSKELDDFLNESVALSNVGACYLEMKEYEKALGYYIEALQVAKKAKRAVTIGGVLSNLGEIYMLLEEYEKAIGNFIKAENVLKEV
ncbi:MAG: hypothetical protein DRJ05_20125, partial [Bacteroidetes bacterium]